MDEVIAEETLVCIRQSGERLSAVASIGRPYQISLDEWACPVSLTGLYGRLHDAHGLGSLQALCLAASLLRQLLRYFVEDGGQLFLSDGETQFPLDATFSKVGKQPEKAL
jgi:hypothetical protein